MTKRIIIAGVVALVAVVVVGCSMSGKKAVPDSVAVIATTGMSCGGCAGRVKEALMEQKGVAKVDVDLAGGRVFAFVDSHQANPAALAAKITDLGYRSTVASVVPVGDFKKVEGSNSGQAVDQAKKGGYGCCDRKQ